MKIFEKKRFWLAAVAVYFVLYGAAFTWVSLNKTKEAEAASWYNNSWNWRKKITINASQIPNSTSLSNFPVLVSVTDSGLQANAQADADDILFTASDATTKLNHEVESYTSGTGTLVAWVSIPTLSDTTDTDIYMYYGNAGASNQQNAASVWSAANYTMVHHLEETGSPPASYTDSTSNANNSSAVTFTNGTAPAPALINGGISYNNDVGVTLPDSATVDPATTLSISGWINPSAVTTPSPRYMVVKLNTYSMYYTPGTGTVSFGYKPNALAFIVLTSAATAGAGNWIYVTGQREAGGAIRLYVNGVQQASTGTAGANLQLNTNPVYLGSNNGANALIEMMDDVRISSVARTAQWLQTEYNNATAPGTFITLAAAEAGPQITFTGFGTFGTTLPRAANQYLGGGFAASLNIGQATITSINLREAGTVDGLNEIDNVKLYYDYDTSSPYNCASESFAGTEPKFALTDTDGFSAADAGTAIVSGGNSVTVTDTQAVCFYPVLDFQPVFTTTKNYVISINNPSTDVGANATVITNTAVSPSGTGSVNGSLALSRPWPSFAYRKELSIDETRVAGSDDHHMFPVLVSITDADLQTDAQSDGDDIYFTNTFGVKLDHEIESYNSGTGALVAWVEMPHLYYNTNTPLIMYYGNNSVSSQQNPAGVWNGFGGNDYRVVHHLEETSPLTTGYLDSTSNDNDSSALDINAGAGPTTGLMGTGYNSVVNDSGITITGNATQNSDVMTVSAWVKATGSAGVINYVLSKGAANYQMYRNAAGTVALATIGAASNTSTSSVSTGNWVYVVVTRPTTGTVADNLFINGAQETAGVVNGSGPTTPATNLVIGSNGTAANAFVGQIDEVRVAAKTNDVSWYLTEFNNQGTPGTFLSVGSEQTRSNITPSASSVVLNSGSNITLTEGATTNVTITGTVTDTDGHTDLVGASAVVFRSGVGQSCSANPNNCYIVASASCSLSSCAGNSCNASCSTNLEYFAEPTDSGAYAAETYQARLIGIDFLNASGGANSASGVELMSLIGLSLGGNVSFGSIAPGTNTGATNSTLVIRNTGNVSIDGDLSGTSICTDYPTCATPVIPVGNLKYSLAPFTYASAGTVLTSSPANLNMSLGKQTAAGVFSESNLYWGINIPNGLINGNYTGGGTLTAKTDS